MSKTATEPVPQGFQTLTPYIIVSEAAELIDFVKNALGAEEKFRTTGSAGGIHCELKIGDSMVMIGGGGEWKGTPNPGSFLIYADDVDAAYQRAIGAGATSMSEPVEQPYGDREAAVSDRFGNQWFFSTKRPSEHNPSDLHTVTPMVSSSGASDEIEFIKTAFEGSEAFRYDEPAGHVLHAKLRIGTSYLAISEAHGIYVERPITFYMYVPDVDSVYSRALASGATSVSEPQDQPYGDRMAGVQDSHGVTWYMATHIKDFGSGR